MIAAGIDLGGTKMEAQIFGADWSLADRRRVPTPREYADLVAGIAELVGWVRAQAGGRLPVGVAAAGLVNPRTGLAYAANLAAMGRPFPADIEAACGQAIPYVNDCRALTLSEAILGAGRGKSPVAGLILGTGVGGGLAIDGRLVAGLAQVGGEFGHMPAPAHVVARHGLPVHDCGCGRRGCFETYIAGPGLTRLCATLIGRALTPPEIAALRATDAAVARVWQVWIEIVAELLLTLTFVIDPEVVIFGGGLSQMEGLLPDLTKALTAAQLNGFAVPTLALASAGDASGARGAALAALAAA